MPRKKNRSNQPASGRNRRATKGGRNSPDQSYDADENLQRPYQGYDENKSSSDPRYEKDFDADEDNVNDRQSEYSDLNRGTADD